MVALLLKDRFDAKWILDGDCWRWTDVPSSNGYGYLSVGGRKGRKVQAHRLAYELYVGPVPNGMELDHRCRNRWCVRPQHLEPLTHRENLLRGDTIPARNARKTHCLRGHVYDELNTLRESGKRRCRTCKNDQRRARRAARRAA